MTKRSALHLDIIDDLGLAPAVNKALLKRVVAAAIADDGLPNVELCVRWVDDATSGALHREHFGDADATDVMSFPDGTEDPGSGRTRLGDLAVCVDVARRVALDRHRAIGDELALYVVHGTLHLLGHDDEHEDDRAAMWAIQQRVLSSEGIDIGPLPMRNALS